VFHKFDVSVILVDGSISGETRFLQCFGGHYARIASNPDDGSVFIGILPVDNIRIVNIFEDYSEMWQRRRKSTFYFRNHFWVHRKVSDVMHALQLRSCKQSESCRGLKARDIDGPPLDFYPVLLFTARGAKTVDKSQVAASFGLAQPSHEVGSLNLREIVDRIVRIVGIGIKTIERTMCDVVEREVRCLDPPFSLECPENPFVECC